MTGLKNANWIRTLQSGFQYFFSGMNVKIFRVADLVVLFPNKWDAKQDRLIKIVTCDLMLLPSSLISIFSLR